MGPADGTGLATTFASTTPDQILRDINGQLTGIFAGMLGVEITDTLLLPYSVLLDISTRRIDAVNQTTILELGEAQQHLHPDHRRRAHYPRSLRLISTRLAPAAPSAWWPIAARPRC
ncbi:DUF2184 domain-containing protein [Mesorhizobium sp. M0833]|uniref:major capsid family protein n=1 Tax=unclassified Mesorhizobium TaxID=325217 RepID=UPI00333CF60F